MMSQKTSDSSNNEGHQSTTSFLDKMSEAEVHQSQQQQQPLVAVLDPMSLLISQNSNPNADDPPALLSLIPTESFNLVRGPRYSAYAELRESSRKSRRTHVPPTKKQVKFQTGFHFPGESKRPVDPAAAALAQSVPDFSAAFRKENIKPARQQSSLASRTPPPAANKSVHHAAVAEMKLRGSKSASAGEKEKKRAAGMMARNKSCAGMEELKGFSSSVHTAIIEENNRGVVSSRRGGVGRNACF